MCKVGSTGAGDINAKVYKKETILKLYKSTRRFLFKEIFTIDCDKILFK